MPTVDDVQRQEEAEDGDDEAEEEPQKKIQVIEEKVEEKLDESVRLQPEAEQQTMSLQVEVVRPENRTETRSAAEIKDAAFDELLANREVRLVNC